MLRRIACSATLAALLAVAVPAVAQAEEAAHWYVGNHPLAPETTAPVTLHGHMTFYIGNYDIRVTCGVNATGTIEGTVLGGNSSIEGAEFRNCRAETGGAELTPKHQCPNKGRVELVPENLPWKGGLTSNMQDRIEGFEALAGCGGEDVFPLEGDLSPAVVPGALEMGAYPSENLLDGGEILVEGHLNLVGPSGRRVAAALFTGI